LRRVGELPASLFFLMGEEQKGKKLKEGLSKGTEQDGRHPRPTKKTYLRPIDPSRPIQGGKGGRGRILLTLERVPMTRRERRLPSYVQRRSIRGISKEKVLGDYQNHVDLGKKEEIQGVTSSLSKAGPLHTERGG